MVWLLLAQVTVDLEVWRPSFDGHLRFDEAPNGGDSIDAWGWERSWSPALTVSADFGDLRTSIRASQTRFQGRDVFDVPLRWNESLFVAGEEVESELTLRRLALAADHVVWSAGEVELRAGLTLRYVRAKVKTEAPTPGRDDDTLSALLPEPGLGGSVALGAGFEAEAEIRGIVLSVFDQRALTCEAFARVTWGPTAAVRVGGGWRLEVLDVTAHDRIQRNEMDILLQGPFLDLAVRF